ncbi:MAG: NapC/NirT family cytochrome c [Deltaproteobacteria bacterium]|nr:NapC/NirT family cytochrome c [Deltaproteobacteria bacterium]
MTSEAVPKKSSKKGRLGWVFGVVVGLVLAAITVLASGFMIETTNTDTFCVSCHYMKPFQTSWKMGVHGGQNPQGFTAQCVDCHLPHGGFVEYFTAKAVTGTNDVVHHLYIDEYTYDWAGAAEKNRLKFTYDNACRHCHHNLTPPGLKVGGFIAHRAYLRGETTKRCTECHPHVGHKNMIEEVNKYLSRNIKK